MRPNTQFLVENRRNWKGEVFDYDAIKAYPMRECQYCLTDAQVAVLGGLTEILGWPTRWQSDTEDISEEWVRDFRADIARRLMLSCCNDDLIYTYNEDGELEVSEDGGVTYTPAHQEDIRLNPKVIFPEPAPIEGTDNLCLAADGMVNLIKEQIGEQLTDDMSRYTLGKLISDWTNTMIGTSNPFQALVTIITNQIFTLVISAVRAALTSDVYELLRCIFSSRMSADISFTEAAWENVRTDTTSQITGIAGVFLEHLEYLLGSGGLTNLARSMAGVDDTECCPCLNLCEIEWTFYGVHDVVYDGCNTYTMLADGGGVHVAFSSGNSATGCYCTDGGLNFGSWWPLGSGAPVGGTNPKTTQIWNYDVGGGPADTPYTFIFSTAPIT